MIGAAAETRGTRRGRCDPEPPLVNASRETGVERARD